MATMTDQATRAGRYLFADLVHIDYLIDTLPYLSSFATDEQCRQWFARRDELVAARDVVLSGLAGILCRKCDGKGRIPSYNHRSHGLCYSCNGSGLTAKGRKTYL